MTKTKKKRNHNVRLIRTRRSYSMSELADLLKIHVRTVQSWRKQGMTPIDPDDRPLLFIGSEIQRFLSQRQKARKLVLKDEEFYCPKCRTAQTSYPQNIYLEYTGRRIGKTDKQVLIKGKCATCDCELTRFSTRRRVAESVWLRNVEQVRARLCRDDKATVNTDLEGVDCDTCQQQE